jgi:hypothetical protein
MGWKGHLMAVPILHVKVALGQLVKKLKGGDREVRVRREILEQLIDLYVSCWDFDEEWYFATYPDVLESVKEGIFPTGWEHFRKVGYFEGRFGTKPSVDADWYVSTYPDIAQAMIDGVVTSALDHYVEHGYAEGRLGENPGVDAKFYAPRYLPSIAGPDDHSSCTEHFVRYGYQRLALPAPPR